MFSDFIWLLQISYDKRPRHRLHRIHGIHVISGRLFALGNISYGNLFSSWSCAAALARTSETWVCLNRHHSPTSDIHV